mmetsp:Transcript_47715/g.140930  ORF Transcript_47715/g.140930 Transcript_47715/m.140930 type:complete len:107 (+) Transcript_47715:265-585(+)
MMAICAGTDELLAYRRNPLDINGSIIRRLLSSRRGGIDGRGIQHQHTRGLTSDNGYPPPPLSSLARAPDAILVAICRMPLIASGTKLYASDSMRPDQGAVEIQMLN